MVGGAVRNRGYYLYVEEKETDPYRRFCIIGKLERKSQISVKWKARKLGGEVMSHLVAISRNNYSLMLKMGES